MVLYQSSDWEGKGLRYYLKYVAKHYPHMLLLIPLYGVMLPIAAYAASYADEENFKKYAPFRPKLLVFRDDDPRIKHIVKFDENGNRIYLEPKTR